MIIKYATKQEKAWFRTLLKREMRRQGLWFKDDWATSRLITSLSENKTTLEEVN